MKNTTSIISKVKTLGQSSYFFKSIANPIQRIFIKTTDNVNMFVILYLLRSKSHNKHKENCKFILFLSTVDQFIVSFMSQTQ